MFGKEKASLSEQNFNLLMTEVNQIIENVADQRANSIISGEIKGEISYPPNCGFTPEEETALDEFIIKNKNNLSLLRKLLADTASFALFGFFNLLDGTGSPTNGNWKSDGVTLVDKDKKSEQYFEVLHDGMYDGYWKWREIRKSDWTLDMLDEGFK